jgi:phage baseplate assembly protein W
MKIINKKFPIDSEARKAVGFGFPINGDAVFVPTYLTKDQIKANLINYLLTNKNERVFNVNFGADLRNLLFQQIEFSTLEDLQSLIQSEINIKFPMITINNIELTSNPDINSIYFKLNYSIDIYGITDELDIILQ